MGTGFGQFRADSLGKDQSVVPTAEVKRRPARCDDVTIQIGLLYIFYGAPGRVNHMSRHICKESLWQ